MQRSTDKQLAITRSEIADLLGEALDHHKHVEAARNAVEDGQRLALFHAWQAGIRLNKIKAIVGHGNWQKWLSANVGYSERTAQVYMKIDTDNAHLRTFLPRAGAKKIDTIVSQMKADTIRKYAIQFVPDKEQPHHKGNAKFPRLVSFVNIANEYNRLKYRHTEGLQPVDLDLAREETTELFQFLQWLHGESEFNPWIHAVKAA